MRGEEGDFDLGRLDHARTLVGPVTGRGTICGGAPLVVIQETARHADIVREQIDGRTGR